MNRKILSHLLLFVLLVGVFSGCNTPAPETPVPVTVKPTATEKPVETEALEPTETAAPVEDVTEAPTDQPTVEARSGWDMYENGEYGFSIQYPKGWELMEDANAVYLSKEFAGQTLRLRIAYRFLSENVDLWGQLAIPSGSLETRGTLTLLRHTMLKKVLVQDEKDKAVFYNGTEEIESGELAFMISLEPTSQTDYESVNITTEMQDEVREILLTLVQHNVKDDGMLTYVNADYGFSFRYPDAWMVLQDKNYIRLSKDTFILNIRYRRLSEEIADWGKIGLPAGDFETRGKSSFLGQSVPRETVVFESRDKAVFYNGIGSEVRAGGLAFMVSLQDMNSDYLAANLSAALLSEVDRIFNSFLLHGAATWASGVSGATEGWDLYTDPTYGFSMSFPQRWEGYQATISETARPATVAFWFESLKPENSLVIQIFTPEEWAKVENRMVYLGENGEHVFAMEPYEPECAKMQAFQCERHKEIPAILETFELHAMVETPSVTACSGGSVWLDAWPVSAACTVGGWSITVFAEGHGGDCLYTYYWNGEKIQGPVNGSVSFDISAVNKNTIMGEVVVETAGQSTKAPVYVEWRCQ